MKNACEIRGGVAKITLTRGMACLVDEADLPLIREQRWFASQASDKHFYASTNRSLKEHSTRGLVRMHRLLVANVEEVDHINGNTLDNRRSNLRPATRLQNAKNTSKNSRNKSGFKGICWDGRSGKWRATIYANKKLYHLGYFQDLADAIEARRAGDMLFQGEFRRTS